MAKAVVGLPHSKMIERLQYAVAWTFVKTLGILPRPLARGVAAMATRLLLILFPKLRKTAEFNLKLAFPDWTDAQRNLVMKQMTRNLGWMAAEFARLPKYSAKNIEDVVVLDGHENFLEGKSHGKGVVYLTGHIGAWELSSYAHALYGFPLYYMARPLDNLALDSLVNLYRGLSGNKPIYKNEAARTMLRVLKEGGLSESWRTRIPCPVKACSWISLAFLLARQPELREWRCTRTRRWCRVMRSGMKICENTGCALSRLWN